MEKINDSRYTLIRKEQKQWIKKSQFGVHDENN